MPGTTHARIFIGTSLASLVLCPASQNSFAQDTTKTVPAIGRDSLEVHTPAFGQIKDSLIHLKPIPLIGALEPYGDSSEAILGSQIPWMRVPLHRGPALDKTRDVYPRHGESGTAQ